MMRYNFRPNLTEHSEILILVRPFSNTSDEDYSFVLSKLSPFTYAKIADHDRTILLNFTKGYSRDTLEWGRLQLHRRPLGFVGVARLSSDPVHQEKDYEKIEHRFDNLISQYSHYIYDSRCIIIGPKKQNIETIRKDMFYLPETEIEISTRLTDYISEFVTSLFVILESKRVDKLSENLERMALPNAPNEGVHQTTDVDSRSMKRKCLGRNKKILADLCLLSGLAQEALMHYSNSVEHFRSVNDFLWLGSAFEGICAASNAMMLGDLIIKENTRFLVIQKSNINVNLTSENGEDEKLKSYLANSTEDTIAKYSECLLYYRKFSTGPVEIEAHFKFIRVLLNWKKKLETAQVIQSLLAVPQHFNESEKLEFTTMLASIHDQLGLRRKAGFYRRRAALLYINGTNQTKSALSKAMTMLKQVSPAYGLVMNQNAVAATKDSEGWSSLQLRVLLDMLRISRKLGNKLDSVRLLCFILERYLSQLSTSDHNDLVDLLEEFSDDTEPLSNEDSKETDVELIRPLPIIRDFHPKRLARYLQPLKVKVAEQAGPFIFSSLSKPKKDEEDVIWVCGDVSEVAMVVDNPLPAEIKVNNMTLLTEGMQFEAFPATLALPAQSGAFPFMLLGTPNQPGSLKLKGYKVEVLGIVNTVLLPEPINVEVTPLLPILKLSSTLPRAPSASSLNPEDENYQTLFTSANLYRGHSCSGKVILENAGKVPITKLDIKLKKLREHNIVFDADYVKTRLPLLPEESLHLDVTIMPENSWKLFNNQDKIEAALIISYSCEEGEVNGYMREISWVTYVKVMPSLEFSNYSILEIERHPSCCMICFDAVNMTSVAMNVTYEVIIENKNLDISSHVNCFGKRHLELLPKKKTSCEVHFPRLTLPPPVMKIKTMEDEYQAFIRSSVCLHWILSDTNYSGVTYLQNIQVTPAMTTILKPKHLSISIRVDNNIIKEGENIRVDECKLTEIFIVLTNTHDINLEDVSLHVNPYQDCYRSSEQMKELYLPSGMLDKGIKKLCPGESFEHSCGLLFLYHGEYMVDVCCSMNRGFGSHRPSRQRSYAIKNDPTSDRHKPPTPRTVNDKLKFFEADFWAQSFCVTVM